MKMNKKDYKKLKENVFDLMCGEVDVALSVWIKNEFEDGSYCDRIYQEIICTFINYIHMTPSIIKSLSL